jgi:hypothetical protein
VINGKTQERNFCDDAILREWLNRIDVHRVNQQYGKAESTCREARHVVTAGIYHNLAGVKHARRHYAAAEPIARQGYQIHCDVLGADHPTAIADGAALGSILHGLERYDEAIPLFERESTGALDPASEADILDHLVLHRHYKTTLMISHRPQVVQRADWIVALENGQLSAIGTLAEISEQPGSHADFI